MDVDRFAGTRVDKDGNVERRLAFNRARGARLSAMEHLVPEQMYSMEDAPAHGISAVKAIQLAAAEGQKICTITQANLDQALASIELSDEVEIDIRNSVYAGKEVTAHETPVNFFGSQSSGYIVLDPYSGAGAYLIEGGENGGSISTPGGTDAVSWLLGLLDKFGQSPWLKSLGGVLDEVISAISLYFDIRECGFAFAIAKSFALLITLSLAIWVSFFIAGIISSFFTAQWSCKE